MEDDHSLNESALYNDLLKDAREMITDMAETISAYWFTGLWMSTYGFVLTGFAIASWYHLLTSGAGIMSYVIAIGETIGGVLQLVMGPALIYWYLQLKERYPGLIPLPRALFTKRSPSESIAVEDLQALKELYDRLWKDARSLTIDINKSLMVYGISGLLNLVYGLAFIVWALAGFNVFSGSASAGDYFAVIFLLIGGVPQLIVGPFLIYRYFKLKKRFSRLIRMEKASGV